MQAEVGNAIDELRKQAIEPVEKSQAGVDFQQHARCTQSYLRCEMQGPQCRFMQRLLLLFRLARIGLQLRTQGPCIGFGHAGTDADIGCNLIAPADPFALCDNDRRSCSRCVRPAAQYGIEWQLRQVEGDPQHRTGRSVKHVRGCARQKVDEGQQARSAAKSPLVRAPGRAA